MKRKRRSLVYWSNDGASLSGNGPGFPFDPASPRSGQAFDCAAFQRASLGMTALMMSDLRAGPAKRNHFAVHGNLH
jgi:hypothetical protein